MKTKGGDIILLSPKEHYDYHGAWKGNPHTSQLPHRDYPEFLSLEEGIRRGEAVRKIVKQHCKKHKIKLKNTGLPASNT